MLYRCHPTLNLLGRLPSGIISRSSSLLDRVALREARTLSRRQPRATITFTTDFSAITVYNYGAYGANPFGGPPSTNNDAALTKMFKLMGTTAPYGGLALIEQYQFPVDASASGFGVPLQCNIVGAGGGGVGAGGAPDFYHFAVTNGTPEVAKFFNCDGADSSGGQYFRTLGFLWAPTLTQDICIFANTRNCDAVDCNFVNCPTAFFAAGLSCGLIRCTVTYDSGPHSAVAVYLQGPQCFVIGPAELLQKSAGSGGPTSCTAIALGGGGGRGALLHGVIRDVHLANWAYAINYSLNPGAQGTHVTNVQAQSWTTSVYMTPPASGQISGEKYTSCTFTKSGDSPDGSASIFIDTNGQDNDAVNDIEFLGCTVYSETATPQANQYCYRIAAGSNIRIIGGTASNAGAATSGGAGIAITPPASNVVTGPGRITILGVDLSAKYPRSQSVHAQQYALVISATPTDVITVDGCKMAGYAGNPVNVSGVINPGLLYIRNCEGYNDQQTPINGGTHGTAPISSANDSAAKNGYYGPSLLTFSNTSPLTVTLNSVAFMMSSGSFYLNPYDTILFGTAPSTSSWIGE